MSNFDWTDERVLQLKALWKEGLSGTQIARVMGCESRDVPIGKARRLGLTDVHRPQRTFAAQKAATKPRPNYAPGRIASAIPPAPLVRAGADDPPPSERIGIMALNDHVCRWPCNDGAPWEFCGRATHTEGPYCPGHWERAHQKKNVKAQPEADKWAA